MKNYVAELIVSYQCRVGKKKKDREHYLGEDDQGARCCLSSDDALQSSVASQCWFGHRNLWRGVCVCREGAREVLCAEKGVWDGEGDKGFWVRGGEGEGAGV